VIFGWDLGVSGMVHHNGHRIAASRARRDKYDADAQLVEKVRRQLTEIKAEHNRLEAELTEAEDERGPARRIRF